MNGEVNHRAHKAFSGAGHDPGIHVWRIEVLIPELELTSFQMKFPSQRQCHFQCCADLQRPIAYIGHNQHKVEIQRSLGV